MPELSFADIARRDFCVHIVDLTAEDWREQLFANLDPPFVKDNPGDASFQNLLCLAKQELKACTAVIEPYISTDWNDEYAALYSRIFQKVPRITRRIHFFSAKVRYQDLYKLGKPLVEAYLGYSVVRPLSSFRVGDTVLRSPCTVGGIGKDLVHCRAQFDVSLLGSRLQVSGMPFLQQETSVAVCAGADLWMVARYLNKKGETRRYQPAEITQLATRTITIGPARAGLFDLQMMDALRQMGLNPVILHAMHSREAKEFMYTCVESELPVIVGMPGHVVVAIGHDYESKTKFDAFTGTTGTMSDAVASFIIHDDAKGPYEKVAVGKTYKQLPDGRELEVLTLDDRPVNFFLVALPPRIHMHWHDVWRHTSISIEGINNYAAACMNMEGEEFWRREALDNLVARVYLRLSSDFKHDLLNQEAGQTLRNTTAVAKYKCMHMPKYVWVVELANRSELQSVSAYERKIRGEILLDSTGNRHIPDETLMALNLNGVMFIPRCGETPAEVIVADDLPYSPLQRSTRER